MNINRYNTASAIKPVTYLLNLLSSINVLSECYFTHSPKTQQEQNFKKSLIIPYRVKTLQLAFLEILGHHICRLTKFKLKLISAKFFLPMILRN